MSTQENIEHSGLQKPSGTVLDSLITHFDDEKPNLPLRYIAGRPFAPLTLLPPNFFISLYEHILTELYSATSLQTLGALFENCGGSQTRQFDMKLFSDLTEMAMTLDGNNRDERKCFMGGQRSYRQTAFGVC